MLVCQRTIGQNVIVEDWSSSIRASLAAKHQSAKPGVRIPRIVAHVKPSSWDSVAPQDIFFAFFPSLTVSHD